MSRPSSIDTKQFRIPCVLFMLTALASCGGEHMPLSDEHPTTAPDLVTFERVSYEKDLLPIFKSQCSRCHNATSDNGNLLDPRYAASIKDDLYERIWVDRDMPPNGKLAEESRALIAAWARPDLNFPRGKQDRSPQRK